MKSVENTKPERWAMYLRISQNRDSDDRKGDRQREMCEAWLRTRGVTEWITFFDDDFSAYGGKKRPDWEDLLRHIESGHVSHFVAPHIDRILRDMGELVGLVKLVERTNAMVFTVQSGDFDLNNYASRQTAYMLGAMAEGQSTRKGELHKIKAAQLRAEGKSQGGARPFGWESPNGGLRPEEAALVHRAIRDLLESHEEVQRDGSKKLMTLYRIRQEWNASGLSTSTHRTKAREARLDGGGMWANNKAVARVLMRYRNAGLVEHQGKVVGPAVWPAISVDGDVITENDIDYVRKLLTDPERRKSPGPTRKHLLSGIATCGRCGHVLRKAQGGHKTAYYRCSNQPTCYLSVQQETLDNLVNLAIRSRFTHDDPARFASSPADRERLMHLRGELVEIEADSIQVAEAVGRGEVSFRSQQAMLKGFQERREEIERSLSLLTSRIATAEMLMVVVPDEAILDRGIAVKRRWEALTLDRRRAIVSELYESIVVRPGRAEVQDRVTMKRRPR